MHLNTFHNIITLLKRRVLEFILKFIFTSYNLHLQQVKINVQNKTILYFNSLALICFNVTIECETTNIGHMFGENHS